MAMMKDLAMCGRGRDACHAADHHHHGGGQNHREAEAGQKELEHKKKDQEIAQENEKI